MGTMEMSPHSKQMTGLLGTDVCCGRASVCWLGAGLGIGSSRFLEHSLDIRGTGVKQVVSGSCMVSKEVEMMGR